MDHQIKCVIVGLIQFTMHMSLRPVFILIDVKVLVYKQTNAHKPVSLSVTAVPDMTLIV